MNSEKILKGTTTRKKINKKTAAIVIIDGLLGTGLCWLNFISMWLTMSLLPGFKKPKISGLMGSMSKILSMPDAAYYAIPFLSTVMLAPSLIRFLVHARGRSRHPWRAAVLAGIIFGFAATAVTCALFVAHAVLTKSPEPMMVRIALTPLAAMFALPFSLAFMIWCGPGILITGALFGVLNLVLIRFWKVKID